MLDDERIKATIENISEEEQAARRFAPLLITRGAIGIIGGIILLFWPGAGLAVVAIALGIFLITDGIERLVTVLRRPPISGKFDMLSLIGAILKIVFGAVILFNPVDAGGFWASLIFIITGINLVVTSIILFWKDSSLKEEPLDAALVALMLILGLLIILMPMISAKLLLRILGGIMVLSAVPSLAIGLRSR